VLHVPLAVGGVLAVAAAALCRLVQVVLPGSLLHLLVHPLRQRLAAALHPVDDPDADRDAEDDGAHGQQEVHDGALQ
jgi:hypothetical protein